MSKLTAFTVVTILFCFALLPLALGDFESDYFGPKLVIRAPRSITNIFKRFFGGRRKQTGFQGTAQVDRPYDIQASSYYPSYFSSPFQSLPPYPSSGYSGLGFGSYPFTSSFSSYPGLDSYGSLAQATSLYPTFSYPASLASSSLDYPSYLDSLIGPASGGRSPSSSSASIAPSSSSSSSSTSSSSSSSGSSSSSSNDQDTSASSLSVKNDYAPSFSSLKSLYSAYPFAFAPETSSFDSFRPDLLFARKMALRRMASDKGAQNIGHQLQRFLSSRQQQSGLKQKDKFIKEQDQIKNMLMNPQEFISQIIQQELASQQSQLQSGTSSGSSASERSSYNSDSSPSATSVSSSTSISSSQEVPSYQSNYYYAGSNSQSNPGKPRQTSSSVGGYGGTKKSSSESSGSKPSSYTGRAYRTSS